MKQLEKIFKPGLDFKIKSIKISRLNFINKNFLLFEEKETEINMPKKCELTGVTVQVGNNVSHSHRKTRRRFLPNLQKLSLKSDILDEKFPMKIAVSTLRSININSGLDKFLVKSKASRLTKEAQKLRRNIKKALKEAKENKENITA